MITCNKCNITKNLNEFSPKKRICKICRNTQQKEYAKNNRLKVKLSEKKKQIRNRNFIYQFKLNKPCIDCGVIYAPCVLQFDHINNKIKNISKMTVNSSIYRIKKEIDKCEIVCTNCHRHRTHIRNLSKNINKKSKTPTRDKLFNIINAIKEKSSCTDCRAFYHSWQMDFDHRDQKSKISNITTMVVNQMAIEQILNEIKKCDLVCANCHAMRSSVQLNYNKHIIV